MKTINIKGREYITVNERLKYFRSESKFNGWQIKESLIHIDEKEGIFKVTISDNKGVKIASAHSQEYRDSNYINKTSFVENGFTSALGRALGYLGIGIDTSIASADEVQSAVKNENASKPKIKEGKKWLTDAQFNATMKATKEQAEKVLAGFLMKKQYSEQIKQKFNI